MATRQEVITYGEFLAPAGTVVSKVVLTFVDTVGNHQTFDVVPGEQPVSVVLVPGSYTATAQAVDANGVAVGPAATDSFVIDAPSTVQVSIPTALTGTTTA